MAPDNEPRAHPPETLEGWFALHQVFSATLSEESDSDRLRSAASMLPQVAADGWSTMARLIGSKADVLAVHFRPTLEEIETVQRAMRQAACALDWTLSYSFLSVTEAGLYHLTAQLARDAAARGGSVGDPAYLGELAQRSAAERESPHVQRRLYPQLPADMPYVCFYPMSKRREAGQNWYQLSLDERSRLMHTHGLT